MEKGDEIVNRVAQSGLVVLDLDKYYRPNRRTLIDLKEALFQGQILREKDFREFIKQHNWAQYKGAFVAVSCSAEAIIPRWAYMLIMASLAPYAALAVFGDLTALEAEAFRGAILEEDWEQYRDARVLVKGCSKVDVPESVYMELTKRLVPVVTSLMYGEACSTVPVFKRLRGADSGPGEG